MAWGRNAEGQLGIGTSVGPNACQEAAPCSATPQEVDGLGGAGPAVTAMARRGPVAGGTSVTITGANLLEAGAVRFGAAAASFTVDSSRSITAVSPPGRRGNVDVTVTTPYGTSAISGRDHFRFTASRP